MSIEFRCQCGLTYRLKDHHAGKIFKCKVCPASTRVPELPSPPPEAPEAGMQAKQPQQTATTQSDHSERWDRRRPEDPFAGFGEILNPGTIATEADRSASTPAPPPAVSGSRVDMASIYSTDTSMSRIDGGPQGQPRLAGASAPGECPPVSWWGVRGVMVGLCAAFFFLPWFSVSAKNPITGETVWHFASGWDFFRAAVEGLARGAMHPPEVTLGAPSEVSLPPGFASIAAGTLMMLAGPAVYVLGLVLAGAMAFVAYYCNGKGAMWPFIVCAAGMVLFIVGWSILSGTEPLRAALDMLEANGVDIGISGWLCAMLVAIIPMSPIARVRPAATAR